MHVKRNTDGRLYNHSYSGKAVSITYSECVCVCVCVFVALLIEHAKRMRHIILPSVACLALPFYILLTVHHVMILGK